MLGLVLSVLALAATASSAPRVYPFLDDPTENPQYARHYSHPPPLAVTTNHTLFATFRGFGLNSSFYVVDYEEDLDLYFTQMQLGEVLWPEFHFLLAVNLADVLMAIRMRNLTVVDIWDYVPGDTDNCYADNSVCEYKLPLNVSQLLFSTLGNYYTGMDVGEQDGRYVGGYAYQYPRQNASRAEQFLYFSRHFERMTNDLGNTVSALTSLYMPHYLLKTGLYTTVGSETAQALPNAQLFLSFDRGACKQYASKWWGNVSVYNRFGYKSYPGTETGGTSLSLMKRLMYSQIMYNSVYVSFEAAWLYSNNNTLSPIGLIQQSARQWVANNQNDIGTFLANVGVVLDFQSGFVPPRQLYNGNLFQVWGSLPYLAGDHFTNSFFDFMYNSYGDSSYFHNETGFQSVTPFGDTVDVLLSDAPGYLLNRYPYLVIAGELAASGLMSNELNNKLTNYVNQGGNLIITAQSLSNIGGLFNITVNQKTTSYAAGQVVVINGESIVEQYDFIVFDININDSSAQVNVIGTADSQPLVYEILSGDGSILLFASPFAISQNIACEVPVTNPIDNHIAIPYPLLSHAALALQNAFEGTVKLFDVGGNQGSMLTFSTNYRSQGEYTISIFNPLLMQQNFLISSYIGDISQIVELEIIDNETNSTGYLPAGYENATLGQNTQTTIAGGSVRIFKVSLSNDDTIVIPDIIPPALPKNRALFLNYGEMQTEVLNRPSFFEHYDTLVADWKLISLLSSDYESSFSTWSSLQSLNVIVDVSSGINLYPDFRLVKNAMDDYNYSMSTILSIMNQVRNLNGDGIIFSIHRYPENWYTDEQCWTDFLSSFIILTNEATQLGLNIYIRMINGRPASTLSVLSPFIDLVNGGSNGSIYIAASTGLLLSQGITHSQLIPYANQIKIWYLSCTIYDILTGAYINVASSLTTCDAESNVIIQQYLSLTPNAIIVPEAAVNNANEEYIEIAAVEALFPPSSSSSSSSSQSSSQ